MLTAKTNAHGRIVLGLASLLGLGLMVSATVPAMAKHDKHAKYAKKLGKHGAKNNAWRNPGNGKPHPRADLDRDGTPNNKDWDIDGDGIANARDTSPYVRNRTDRRVSPARWPAPRPTVRNIPWTGKQRTGDFDHDGIPNNRDRDIDGDGIINGQDPQPWHRNPYLARRRAASAPRRHTTALPRQRVPWDRDGDGVPNNHDPRPNDPRRGRDLDRDGIRNKRDRDIDGDGIINARDRDRDNDGIRNANDRFPRQPKHVRDIDKDGIRNKRDRDIDGDGRINAKDRDRDGDGVRNGKDKKPRNAKRH